MHARRLAHVFLGYFPDFKNNRRLVGIYLDRLLSSLSICRIPDHRFLRAQDDAAGGATITRWAKSRLRPCVSLAGISHATGMHVCLP